ncbi:type III secretion protein HrpB4 [Rhizobacter sp. OV335]|uniref:type III secretion protein HrpB4 n=1 Tax=Rhizobacter sp. OV335 TaxID=1500264 RepID=UPI0009203F61|nr:type III secretion protein HrpB4 [Rhizobacter sp. OV335]SHN21806.1 type III secretion protein (HrpB4) [Rhizobacter sp. OV335]
MNALPASAEPVPLLRHLLATARAKSADIAAQLHPAWVQAAWQRIGFDTPPAGAGARSEAALASALGSALGSVYGLRWASLAGFQHRAHRIALLPRDQVLRVLAAVALHAERERVRRCIGRGARQAIIERIGEAAYNELMSAPRAEAGAAGALSASDLDPERLAAAGYARLSERREWHCKHTLAWVRLALAPGSTPSDPSFAFPSASSSAAPSTSPPGDSMMARLPHYFPEHAWLFGSPMDRALSA